MTNWVLRLKRRVLMTVKNWKNDCTFSVLYASYRLLEDFCGRIGMSTIAKWTYEKRKLWIMSYLEILLKPTIQKYKDMEYQGVYDEMAPIWICWWTGIDTAPKLVQQCVKSIQKNAGKHPVHMITKETFDKHVEIPEYMLQKVSSGQMGLAHLADYLRVCLLEKYGGLWIDATMFCSQTIPITCFELPVFTCKSEWRESRYVSNYQWVTFCLGGWKGNVFYQFLKESFEIYWQENEVAIDYLFFDYLIYIGKLYVPAIKQMLEDVPINNIHRDDLQAAMNEAVAAEEISRIICEDTALYKLSWRETYSVHTCDNQESVYSYFLNMKIFEDEYE